ncbi:MAG: hypothetical protein C0403_16275 [Desulfobacterium sp.]|nr:hypothetical protein [Desulfobacterium sp.]
MLHEDCFLSVSGIIRKSGIAAILFGGKQKILWIPEFWGASIIKKRATTRDCPYNKIVLQMIYNRQIHAEACSPFRVMVFPGSCCTCFTVFALSSFPDISIRVACSYRERLCHIRFGFADSKAFHDLLECLAFKAHVSGGLGHRVIGGAVYFNICEPISKVCCCSSGESRTRSKA